MQFNHPKTWAYIALIAAILIGMLLIIKQHEVKQQEENQLQQKIENHSEISDSTLNS